MRSHVALLRGINVGGRNKVHVVFRTAPYRPDDQEGIDEAVRRARTKGYAAAGRRG